MAADINVKRNNLYLKGKELFRARKLDKALKLITKSADIGNGTAMYFLAYLYKNGYADGINVPSDKEKAFYWMKKTADEGFLGAAYDCAELDPDKNNWIYWMEKAAKLGNKRAAYAAACYYQDPDGEGHRDLEKAFYWYGIGAEKGDSDCIYEYAMMYKNGEGTPEDPVKAFHLMEKVAKGSNDKARYELAKMLYEGKGCTRDLKTASHEMDDIAKYYKYKDSEELSEKYFFAYQQELAESGDDKEKPGAWYEVGCCYEEGKGTEQDYVKAAYWYEKAAKKMYTDHATDLNHVLDPELFKIFDMIDDHEYEIQAQKKLAALYFEGKGVEQDYLKAYYWFVLAARMGDEDAQSIEKVRQKVWDLKEETVNRIFADCLDNEGMGEGLCSEYEVLSPELLNEGSRKYHINRVKAGVYSSIIDYMYGQLKIVHDKYPVVSLDDGYIDYTGNQWTKNHDAVEELYILGIANELISGFFKLMDNTIVTRMNPDVLPTLYSEDPEYHEWYENVYKTGYRHYCFFSWMSSVSLVESFIKDDKEKYLHLKQITKNFWDEYPKERERIIKQIKERLMKADHVSEEEKEKSAALLDSFLIYAEVNDYYLYRVNHDPQERLELLSEMVFVSAKKDQNNNSKIQQFLDGLDEILKEQNTDPGTRIKAKIYSSQELLSKGMLEIAAKEAFNLDVE